MNGRRTCLSRRQCLLALAAASFATSLAAQQQNPANIRSISRFYLKPERAADFRTIVKEINAVLKKNGHHIPSTWWASQTGPAELAVVTYSGKWAELDGPTGAWKEAAGELAPLQARAMQCIDRTERVIDVVQPDLSMALTPDPPALVMNLRVRVRPDRIDEYMALVRDELLPAAKKGSATTYLVTRTRFGAPTSEFRTAVALKSWADLDSAGPVVTGLGGQEAYQKFLTKLRPLLLESEYTIYRRVADLDYRPAK